MDPALWELLHAAGDATVEAIIRLDGPEPPGVEIVSRFGSFATCRLRSSDIIRIHEDAAARMLKAPRRMDPETVVAETLAGGQRTTDRRRPDGLDSTGRGVVVGIADWGCDVTHPDLRNADGSTRLLALWDQRGRSRKSPSPWGYGRVHTRSEIDSALRTPDPLGSLGYRMDASGRSQQGTHGTHVSSIAVGNGNAGGPMGMAPEAELVFVHLAEGRTGGLADLSDSVRVLEAVDFILRTAAGRPTVVNLSVGSQGGSHDGFTGVELALDAAVTERPGRAIIQSTGNYFSARAHASEDLRPGETWMLEWHIFPGDRTPNELEIWYPGVDVTTVHIIGPDGSMMASVPLGGRSDISVGDTVVGRIYHRRRDPNGDHHVDCFLWSAPPGRWRVGVEAVDVTDGRCRAWIERDAPRPPNQSMFSKHQADRFGTTGTIANGLRTIAVGAYDPHTAHEPIASFSSAGPTRDGRQKPDLVAPGVASLAARSASRGSVGGLTRKSGTSMASPVVAGIVACMFQAAGRPLHLAETRAMLLGSARTRADDDQRRVGSGRVDVEAAVAAARTVRA